LAAPMDSVVSPETAIAIGKLGGLGVLNLEGLWTRHENPKIQLGEIASLPQEQAIRRMQELYAEPIRPELIKNASQRFVLLVSPLLQRYHHSALQSYTRRLSQQV